MTIGTWAPVAGGTLLMPSGPKVGQKHLHVILNDPTSMPTFGDYACALACLCSVPTTGIPYDSNREFQPGAHPFIVKQTYVSYSHMQVTSAKHLMSCVVDGTFVPHDPFPAHLVQYIIEGYKVSRKIPGYLRGLQL